MGKFRSRIRDKHSESASLLTMLPPMCVGERSLSWQLWSGRRPPPTDHKKGQIREISATIFGLKILQLFVDPGSGMGKFRSGILDNRILKTANYAPANVCRGTIPKLGAVERKAPPFPPPIDQCFGSVFIFYGSGSRG
jgi:hypothetical protein